MQTSEIEDKIRDLLASGQQENCILALELIQSQLNMSVEDFLRQTPLTFQPRANSRTGEDFGLKLELGPVLLQYEYSKRYAPYVGTIERAFRKLGLRQAGQLHYPPKQSLQWEVKGLSATEIQAIFKADFQDLVPYIHQQLIADPS